MSQFSDTFARRIFSVCLLLALIGGGFVYGSVATRKHLFPAPQLELTYDMLTTLGHNDLTSHPRRHHLQPSRGMGDGVTINKIGDDGLPLIDAHSHVALATSRNGNAERMLRRAYNYDLPVTAGAAGLQDADLIDLSDTGLIFTCFQRDPGTSFIPVQRRLAEGDRLNEWITHVGSAVFHVPGGTTGDSYWGEDLLG